jgi:hypothetical protein
VSIINGYGIHIGWKVINTVGKAEWIKWERIRRKGGAH